jgi:catechol 2,3-dioxygenase-like lactoylglutathione lyase family enzyme
MLGSADVVAFIPTRDPAKARWFYGDVLDLKLVSEDAFALVFDANGVPLRVVDVSRVDSFAPAPFAILGWSVPSVEDTAKALAAKGVRFERFPGMQQNPMGIWESPSGARVAWFKDLDGNLLSLSQP